MESFRFAHPEALYLILLVPVVIALMYIFHRSRVKALRRFGDIELLSHLMPDYSRTRVRLKAWLIIIAIGLQVLVVAGPQFGSKIETVKRSGIEVMIALDVSNSMNAQDVSPSRLSMAKMAVSRLVDKLDDDKVGLVVFAGNPYVQMPMTSDFASVKMFMQSITTGMVPTQGTAIGSAINLCRNSFSQSEDMNRAIVVITDGENHEDDAIEAAKEAQEAGIRVYTVGMGTTKGAPVPVTAGQSNEFIKDRDGNIVITKIDEASLAQVAAAGNGAYIPANNIRGGINSLVDELNKLDKSEIEARVYSEYEDRGIYLELVVLALLLIDMLVLSRKNPRLEAFDIFTRKKTSPDLFVSVHEVKPR